MPSSSGWTREQLLVAFALYCRLPFGKLHKGTPEIVRIAEALGRTPSALAMKLSNIASLDPAIRMTGRAGLTGASAADRAMWAEMESAPGDFAAACHKSIAELDPHETALPRVPEPRGTEHLGEDRPVLTKGRIGQSFFRSAVLSAYNWRCCISGLSVPTLLVASHIVPWRLGKLNRLNPRNGLALSALHDRAFDAGLITIGENMTIIVSDKLAVVDDAFFATAIDHYRGKPIMLPGKFGIGKEFLAFHREHIFLG